MWIDIDRDEFMKLRRLCPTFKRIHGVVIWYTGKGNILVTYNEMTKTYRKWQ